MICWHNYEGVTGDWLTDLWGEGGGKDGSIEVPFCTRLLHHKSVRGVCNITAWVPVIREYYKMYIPFTSWNTWIITCWKPKFKYVLQLINTKEKIMLEDNWWQVDPCPGTIGKFRKAVAKLQVRYCTKNWLFNVQEIIRKCWANAGQAARSVRCNSIFVQVVPYILCVIAYCIEECGIPVTKQHSIIVLLQ